MNRMGRTRPNGSHEPNRNEMDPNGLKSIEQYLYVGDSCMVIKEYRTKFMNFKISREGQVRKSNVGRVNFFYSNSKRHLGIMKI